MVHTDETNRYGGWDVPIVNMTQAATMAGIGRSTLYRHAKKGTLSTVTLPDGSPGIDTSELFRVFPVAQSQGHGEAVKVIHEETRDTALLKLEIDHLRELLAAERRNNEDLRLAMRQIEHKHQNEVPERSRGFFSRVFGGKQ